MKDQSHCGPLPLESLTLLCLIAQLHGIAADVDSLAHQLALTSETPQNFDLLHLAASKLGLKASQELTPVERLHLTPLPALTQLQNGQWVIVAAANTSHVLLQYAKATADLTSEFSKGKQPVKLTLREFAGEWLGPAESNTASATKGRVLLLGKVCTTGVVALLNA